MTITDDAHLPDDATVPLRCAAVARGASDHVSVYTENCARNVSDVGALEAARVFPYILPSLYQTKVHS